MKTRKYINLVGSGNPSTKSKKTGTGMGRAKSQKGTKGKLKAPVSRLKSSPLKPG